MLTLQQASCSFPKVINAQHAKYDINIKPLGNKGYALVKMHFSVM